ncbi:hypothetical protein TSOC_007719 [Tetrabaena socialis]|uniref:Uncharacterized protein n=1 Tax=Tetrabaena socialis TaxID=47790 RepID=A0A2J8A0B5_9CHLO|nr:hypothetical protein TSOC_007719 [Tetrabaena socialis]|eukprot:PNH05959.1 hypothetical protein TSOC_007719 [Tetrabaena socialis]
MVTSPSSLPSSSSLRMASWMWRGTMRFFLLSRAALPASSSTSAVKYSSTAARREAVADMPLPPSAAPKLRLLAAVLAPVAARCAVPRLPTLRATASTPAAASSPAAAARGAVSTAAARESAAAATTGRPAASGGPWGPVLHRPAAAAALGAQAGAAAAVVVLLAALHLLPFSPIALRVVLLFLVVRLIITLVVHLPVFLLVVVVVRHAATNGAPAAVVPHLRRRQPAHVILVRVLRVVARAGQERVGVGV